MSEACSIPCGNCAIENLRRSGDGNSADKAAEIVNAVAENQYEDFEAGTIDPYEMPDMVAEQVMLSGGSPDDRAIQAATLALKTIARGDCEQF